MKHLRRTPIVIILLGLAWGLRLYNLGRPELWFDEAASHFIANMSFGQILTYVSTARFEHPPLYYFLLHICLKLFGENEWALRFPSAFFGLLFIAGLYHVSIRLLGEKSFKIALMATVLASLSPFLVTYGQEARMYTMLQCLGLIATWIIWLAVNQRRTYLWLVYGLVICTGIFTHYYFVFLLPAHALIFYWGEKDKRRLLRILSVAILAVLILLAVLIFAAPGLRSALAQVWRESLWGKAPADIWRLFIDWTFGGAIIQQRPAWASLLAVLVAVPAVLGSLNFRLSLLSRKQLTAWAFIPLLCAIAVPYGGLALRHFSYIVPALCLLTAAGLDYLWQHRRWLALTAVLPLLTACLFGLHWQYHIDKGSYGAALAEVNRQKQPGDFLLFANPHQWVLSRYYNRTGLPMANAGDNVPLPASALAQAKRIWFVEWETWALPDIAALRSGLADDWSQAASKVYSQDLTVRLFYKASPLSPLAAAPLRWGDIVLNSISGSENILLPGAVQWLEISWPNRPGLEQNTAVTLKLVDDHDVIWVENTVPLSAAKISSNADMIISHHSLIIPGGTPPGNYRLQMGIINLANGSNLTAFNKEEQAVGPWAEINTVTLQRGIYVPPIAAGKPTNAAPGLRYLGLETGKKQLNAGGNWQGILQFAATGNFPAVQLRAELLYGKDTRQLGSYSLSAGSLDGDSWQTGETWRCQYSFRLPPDLQSGEYTLALTAITPEGQPLGQRFAVDHFTVKARTPHRAAATPENALDVSFAGQIRLYGYDLSRENGKLYLRLYWQSLSPSNEKYKVFVHLLAQGQEQPVDQADAFPAEVSTDSWLTGESFISEHQLTLSGENQEYQLRLGLYSEQTMQRPACSGTGCVVDHLLIPVP